MRELGLDILSLQNCCKVDVISDFGRIGKGKKITDEEWFDALSTDWLTSTIIVFAHSSQMNSGPCTPRALALWLEQRGEAVTALKGTKRGNNSHITLYTCELSRRFMKELSDYLINKQKEEKAKYDEQCRGTSA